MRGRVCLVMIAVLVAAGPLQAQQPVSPDVESAALRDMAAAIPLGTRVRVQLQSGRRLTATLMAVDANRIVLKRDSRRPEPAITIPLAEIAQLRRDEKTGFTWTKALGIGLSAGVAAILTIFAIAVSIGD